MEMLAHLLKDNYDKYNAGNDNGDSLLLLV
jgi:hypothetical protein